MLPPCVKSFAATRAAIRRQHTQHNTTHDTTHTTRSRFFPADRDAADKGGNTPPGTLVDAAACSPSGFEFYLTSHASLSGHVRPARYSVAVDESGFSADGFALLTYWLTYLFARCTK